MKNINRQRKASLRILSLAMVVAVYLNWQYSRTSNHIRRGRYSGYKRRDNERNRYAHDRYRLRE